MPTRFSLLRFWRSFRPDSAPPAPIPDGHPRPTTNHPDWQAIVLKWKQLGTLDPGSHDHTELLKRLVDVEANRNLALKSTGRDAAIVINAIDKTLRGGAPQRGLIHHSFSMLRKLAGYTGQVPASYLINKGADYQVEDRIFACGGFADVRRGRLGVRAVAVKTIRIAQDMNMTKIRKEFCKESVLWMHTSHPNVLGLIAVDVDNRNGTFSLISELMVHGNIMDYIRVNEANRVRLLEDVTRGLKYLHGCEIIHGDLKGTNILIRSGGNPSACISDFGFSTIAPTASFAMPTSLDEDKGTWSHMAPELLFPTKFGLQDCRVSKQADVYAFGIVVYEVLLGRTPFGGEGRRMTETLMRVVEGTRPSKPENAEAVGFSNETWDLIQRCWHEDRDMRPVVGNIRRHFQIAARTSTVIPPGPAVFIREAGSQETVSESEDSTGHFIRLFTSSSQASTNMIQQVKFTASVIAGGGNLHSIVSMPRVQPVRAKPSLCDRLGAYIKDRGLVRRIAIPPPPPLRA